MVTPNTGTRLMGRVKWFNNKAGYGFVTINVPTETTSDIFVHHASIDVEEQQYRYLVQGEYVEFEISNAQLGTHESQAVNVRGINGGKLMCETRHEFKMSRNDYKTVQNLETSVVEKTVSNERKTKVRGDGPRSTQPRSVQPRSVQPRSTRPRNEDEWSRINKPLNKGTVITK